MKQSSKLGVLTVAALAIAASSQAATYNGDLLVGFTAQSGNDLVYDLGAAASITNGQTWNLNSLISGYDLTTVDWGVIGDKVVAGNGVAWTSRNVGIIPGTLASLSSWSALDTPTKSIYTLFTTAGAGQHASMASTAANSWNTQTINGTLSTTYHKAYANPNVAGNISNSFYQVVANGSPPTLLGSFSLATNGILTFTVASSAPPAPTLTITRTNNTSTISFAATNGATYSLIGTNIAGLMAPRTNWTSLGSPITGAGGVTNFTDTTADPDRVYSVTAH